MDWIRGWDLPGLSAFFTVVSLLTSLEAGLVSGVVGMAGLLIARQHRLALAFFVVGSAAAVASFAGDYTLGELVERSRPISGVATSSYPSGHVFGGTVLFGFLALLPFHHRLQRRYSVPVFLLPGLLVVAVGPSRIHDGDHWPSDVCAGCLMGWALLMVVVPVYRRYAETGAGLGLPRPRLFSGVKRGVTKRADSSKAAR